MICTWLWNQINELIYLNLIIIWLVITEYNYHGYNIKENMYHYNQLSLNNEYPFKYYISILGEGGHTGFWCDT